MNQPSNKIIQIGYVVVDTRTQKVIGKRSLIVDPYEPLNPDIIELTGITEDIINNQGKPLRTQYEAMIQDHKDLKITSLPAQWGVGDVYHLKEELGLTWEEFLFKRRAIDVKALYQAYAAFSGETTKTGLASAMKRLNLEFEGRQHDALDDAYNTYRVLQVLANKMLLADKLEKIVR